MKSRFRPFSYSVLLGLIVWACANIGMPSGGIKDEIPPQVVSSTPVNQALNYNKKIVVIEFDELIQLKDVRQKFVISPPMNEQPTIEARGNKLQVTFNEDLQPNTTYALDFADAIVDNNEGNVLENFSFSFSTGEYIDSLQISGNVYDSDDLAPASGVMVFLHENLADSAIHKLVPVRMAKTNSFGRFTLLNVRPGKYRVYALDDSNRDFKFDQPGERMAWSDLIVEPSFEYREFVDTLHIDSLETDSLIYHNELVYTPDSIRMLLFQHDYKRQYLLTEERNEKAKLTFYFNRKHEDEVKLSLTGKEDLTDLFIKERSLNNDTVTYWLKDSTYYNQDSLSVKLSYTMQDSMGVDFVKNDTIAMYFFEVAKEKKKKRKKDEGPEPIPLIKLTDVKSKVDIYGIFSMSLPTPAVSFDKSAVQLYYYEDTIPSPVDFELVQDSLNIRRYTIDQNWIPGGKYELTIDSAAIVDVYGLHNGPENFIINVKKEEDYGKIYIKIDEPQENWLVQVLGKNDKIIQQSRVPSSGKIGFRYLSPGKYMFRIVVDENGNNQWDDGNYYEGRQPEQLIYFPSQVNVRANWDAEIDSWNPSTFSVDKFSKEFRKPKKRE
nr:Ig-like domain-containing protein [uncultured Carboxylicivirga sp.]